MTTQELVVAVMVAFFAAGGPLVAWINARAASKPRVTTDQAEIEVVAKTAQDLGIEERWKKYADDVEDRLNERINDLESRLTRTRTSLDVSVEYNRVLRNHIHDELPPPPPPWPDGIF